MTIVLLYLRPGVEALVSEFRSIEIALCSSVEGRRIGGFRCPNCNAENKAER